MAQSVYTPAAAGMTCWQCSAPAQREKDGVGACKTHLLPNRAQRRELRKGGHATVTANVTAPQARPASQRDTTHKTSGKPPRVVHAPVATPTAGQPDKNGVISRESHTCEESHMTADGICESGHTRVVTYYGGGLPLPKTGPDRRHISLSTGPMPGGTDYLGQAYRKLGRKIDYRNPK